MLHCKHFRINSNEVGDEGNSDHCTLQKYLSHQNKTSSFCLNISVHLFNIIRQCRYFILLTLSEYSHRGSVSSVLLLIVIMGVISRDIFRSLLETLCLDDAVLLKELIAEAMVVWKVSTSGTRDDVHW